MMCIIQQVTKFPVPTNLNGKVVQTNGMLVTSDGMLVLKQWNFNLEDAFYMKAGLSPDSRRLLTAAIVICTSLCVLPGWFFYKKRLSIASLIVRFTLGLLLGAVLVVVLITVSVKQMTGPFNYFDFITSNTILMNGGGGGELKLIDPITFATVAEVKLPERCSYARMSMTPIFSPQGDLEEDAIVLLGDEHVFQLRWRSVENSLKLASIKKKNIFFSAIYLLTSTFICTSRCRTGLTVIAAVVTDPFRAQDPQYSITQFISLTILLPGSCSVARSVYFHYLWSFLRYNHPPPPPHRRRSPLSTHSFLEFP